MRGWVYILGNRSMPGTYKVGHTAGSPHARAAGLHTTGVPTPFIVEYSVLVDRCADVELLVHKRLALHRISKNREFFTISLPSIIQEVEYSLAQLGITRRDAIDPKRAGQRARVETAKQLQAETEDRRRSKIEAQAKILRKKALEPRERALAKVRPASQLFCAVLVLLGLRLYFIINGHINAWEFLLGLIVWFFGSLVSMMVGLVVIDHLQWFRSIVEQERQFLEAVEIRREAALRSPAIDSIIID